MAIPEYITEIKLDVACEDPPIIVPAKQLDNLTRQLKVTMYDSTTGEDVSISSVIRAEFHVTRPDGVLIETDQTIIIGSAVIVRLSESMLAVAGKALADVKLFEEDKIFSAASFALDIQRTATGRDTSSSGILTQVNVKAVNKADFDTMTKELNTLYIVKDGSDVSLYYGSIPIQSGSLERVGTSTALTNGTNISNTGVATYHQFLALTNDNEAEQEEM